MIVHFGDPALTWRAVASLPRAWQGGEIQRVVLVENDPDHPAADACPSRYTADQLPTVDVIGPPRNRGYGAGINACLEGLIPEETPWLLIVNNDAVLEPGCVDELLRAANVEPGASVFAPLIASPVEASANDREPTLWAAGGVWQPRRARAFNLGYDVPLSAAGSMLEGNPTTQPFVSGCIMLCRVSPLQAIGGFDPAFFLYYEDVDLCLRLGDGAAAFVPAARARHDVSQGLRFSPRQTYFNWRNRWWIARRQLRGMTRLTALAYLFAMTVLHPLIRREKPWLGHLGARWRALLDGALGRVPSPPAPISPASRCDSASASQNRNES